MNVDSRLPEYALAVLAPRRLPLVPAWCLRIALRWTEHGIARLEAALADDFATDATLPMHRELQALAADRRALRASLAERRRA